MKWWACSLVVVVACKGRGGEPHAGSGSAHPVVPMPIDAGAAPTDASAARDPRVVDLLRSVPVLVRVSSRVKNARITPEHLVDRDLQTAWNSQTGDLVGAWVDLTFPTATVLTELKLTVGHTGTGPAGEDYFTMNPRIVKLAVSTGDLPATTVTLDPERRDPQVIPVEMSEHVRLEVLEILPGTNKSWREVAISELEAWGVPPAGWTPPGAPLSPIVETNDPTDPCMKVAAGGGSRARYRDAMAKKCNELPTEDERRQCNVDPIGDATCVEDPVVIEDVAVPWRMVLLRRVIDDDWYGPSHDVLQVRTDSDRATAAQLEQKFIGDLPPLDVEATIRDVVPGAPGELVLRYQTSDKPETQQLVVCRAAPTLACTKPMALAGDGWAVKASFADGAVVLAATSGTPPAGVPGKHPVVFE